MTDTHPAIKALEALKIPVPAIEVDTVGYAAAMNWNYALTASIDTIRSMIVGEPWKPISSAPMNGKPFYVREMVPMRFKPYSKNSKEFKRGIKGRWQRMTDYGGWENCSDSMPSEWCTNEEGNAWLERQRAALATSVEKDPLETAKDNAW